MTEFFGSVWWLLVTLGLLITFHEYGHYLAGRLCGVKVLRFSIGFGKPFWRRTDRHGTEFAVAPIPLGGYVKFLDEREEEVPAQLRAQAFNNKSLGQRTVIVAAGPAANLLFALVAFWAMYLVGKQDFMPVVGQVDGIAAEAGVQTGDRLLSIDGVAVDTWTHAALQLITAGVDRRAVPIQVTGGDGDTRSLQLDLDRLPADVREPQMLFAAGLIPRHLTRAPVIGQVPADLPAANAGLLPGDVILAVGGQPVQTWNQVPGLIQQLASAPADNVAGIDASDDGALAPVTTLATGAAASIVFTIQRDGRHLQVPVQPAAVTDADGERRFQVGIGVDPSPYDYDALLRFGPVQAMAAAGRETWTMTSATVGMLWRMVAGRASVENLSGPISISRYANASARSGLAHFLWFLGVISLSLCIINLLPIPILDGGHLLYYLIELIKGSPVSEGAMVVGQYIGLVLLAGLMGLAFYNDIARLFS